MVKGLFLSIFFTAQLFAADAAPLVVEFGESNVTIRNVSAGGDVAILAVALESTGGLLREISGSFRRTDDDADGTVIIPMGRSIPLRTIVVAVDIESTRYKIAAPDGYEPVILPFPTELTRKDAEGVLGIFDAERISARMLLVTRKGGAWQLVATEGSRADADGSHNGKLSLANADARPISGNAAPPKHLKNGDVVAVIDPGTMEVFALEIGK